MKCGISKNIALDWFYWLSLELSEIENLYNLLFYTYITYNKNQSSYHKVLKLLPVVYINIYVKFIYVIYLHDYIVISYVCNIFI